MQQRYKAASGVAAAATIVLTTLRLAGAYHAAVLLLSAVATAALFFLGGVSRRKMKPVKGTAAVMLAAASLLVGTSLIVYAVGTVARLGQGIYPYPQPVTVTVISRLLAFILPAGALAGGVFFLVVSVRWGKTRQVERRVAGEIALTPVIWSWARLMWYMASFTSAVNRFRSLPEVAVLVLEMLFLLQFARYASGVEEKQPRFAVAIALSTAMLGLTVCFTRFGAYLMQDETLFSAGALLTAPDLGLALLAAAFAVGQMFGREAEAVAKVREQEPPPAEEPAAVSAGEAPVFEESNEPLEESGHKPLELEDIINEIINREP